VAAELTSRAKERAPRTSAGASHETHRVAQKIVYLFPDSRVIDDRYLEKALPVIHEQLAKAAVRLAGVLKRAVGTNWRLGGRAERSNG